MPSPMTIQARKITGEASRLGEREEARGQEDRSGREHRTAACPLDPAANEGETRPASTERQQADHRKARRTGRPPLHASRSSHDLIRSAP